LLVVLKHNPWVKISWHSFVCDAYSLCWYAFVFGHRFIGRTCLVWYMPLRNPMDHFIDLFVERVSCWAVPLTTFSASEHRWRYRLTQHKPPYISVIHYAEGACVVITVQCWNCL
jgi:hypothetical protein